MTDLYDAFAMSPVPNPGPDAVAPEPFRGIYAMPMFVTVQTTDLNKSVEFWTAALDFFELFSIPASLVHLRRWAFQDVLLVPSHEAGTTAKLMPHPLISCACLLSELAALAQNCRDFGVQVTGPYDTAWNTRDLDVITPEGVRLVFTAAKPWDQTSERARGLNSLGIAHPEQD